MQIKRQHQHIADCGTKYIDRKKNVMVARGFITKKTKRNCEVKDCYWKISTFEYIVSIFPTCFDASKSVVDTRVEIICLSIMN